MERDSFTPYWLRSQSGLEAVGKGLRPMVASPTRRQEMVLAAMAAVPDAKFAPVQVQKLFFLIDERLSDRIGGKLFDFAPYHYGPFDSSVYWDLEKLEEFGFVKIEGPSGRDRRYSLTNLGERAGASALESHFDVIGRKFLYNASEWVRSLSFAGLVGAIYKEFPEMRAKSIFSES